MSDVSVLNLPEIGEYDIKDAPARSAISNISIFGTTNSTGSTIAKDTYFYIEGALCKAKTDISNGATLTENTNYEKVSKGLGNAKQDVLTFDSAPTSGSSNPVTSGGIFDALVAKSGIIRKRIYAAAPDDLFTKNNQEYCDFAKLKSKISSNIDVSKPILVYSEIYATRPIFIIPYLEGFQVNSDYYSLIGGFITNVSSSNTPSAWNPSNERVGFNVSDSTISGTTSGVLNVYGVAKQRV